MRKLFMGLLLTLTLSTSVIAAPMTVVDVTNNGHTITVLDGEELSIYHSEVSESETLVSSSVLDIEGRLVKQVQKVTSVNGSLVTIESGDMFYTDTLNHFVLGDTVVVIETEDGWNIIKCNLES